MDLELQTEKVERLERELADLTSVGSRDNNEVCHKVNSDLGLGIFFVRYCIRCN